MKNILIIGGSSGIGASLIEKYKNDSNYQITSSFNRGNIFTAENIKIFKFDVLSDDLDTSILPETIDGVVYCPGSINLLPFHRIKLDAFRADFELQVMGAIKVIQTILPHLKKSSSASIVFFSTVAVQSGFNFHTQVAASKGAIEGLTRSLAAELAPKIRVNAIAPSLTDTPLASKLLGTDEKKQANAERHPLKKIGTSENIAEVAQFLLSDKSQWMSGQIMAIDGGISTLRV